jgi:hypothetical protein
MCASLDELQLQYRALLRHGIVPTGLLIDVATLAAIRSEARREDPRLEWNEDRLDRLFGFRPQVVDAPGSSFTSTSRSAPFCLHSKHYTLSELRAL